jgi:hypothetical protein
VAKLPDAARSAVSALSDPASTTADVAIASAAVVSACDGLAPKEVSAAATVLLPGLGAQLTVLTEDCGVDGEGAASERMAALRSVCQAMSLLTDHAGADVLASVVAAGVPRQLAGLLELCARDAQPAGVQRGDSTSSESLLEQVRPKP